MSLAAYASPVTLAPDSARSQFFSQVGRKIIAGLAVAFLTGAVTAVTIAPVLLNSGTLVMMAYIFGLFFVANSVAQKMVFGDQKTQGFYLGTAAMGAAMGPLLYTAALIGGAALGNPLALIFQAGTYTAITFVCFGVYLSTGRKDLSVIGKGLSALAIPMLIAMGLSFVFPITGGMGIVLSLVFVGVSGASLLYSMNKVMHSVSADMPTEAAYLVTLSLLSLFWNILVLLMRLTSRD